MKMTAVEKYFVNSSNHTRHVADRAMQLLGRINLEATGIDVDPLQIAAAKRGAPRQNLHFRTMDATRLDFRDAEFDIVATSTTTHHIPDWEGALSEMVRVLRSGGYFIYGDHVIPSWLAKASRRMARFMRFPSAYAIDAWANKAGLTKVYEAKRYNHVDIIWLKNA
jgi:ubiquinone/menaquinone biosynthesis C-methylase UbiE